MSYFSAFFRLGRKLYNRGIMILDKILEFRTRLYYRRCLSFSTSFLFSTLPIGLCAYPAANLYLQTSKHSFCILSSVAIYGYFRMVTTYTSHWSFLNDDTLYDEWIKNQNTIVYWSRPEGLQNTGFHNSVKH